MTIAGAALLAAVAKLNSNFNLNYPSNLVDISKKIYIPTTQALHTLQIVKILKIGRGIAIFVCLEKFRKLLKIFFFSCDKQLKK